MRLLYPAGILPLAALWAMTALLFAQSEWVPRLKNYVFGQSPIVWTEIDKGLRSSMARERKAAEEVLVEVLLARGATPDSRIMACRRLRFATQNETIAALISLLNDPRVSSEARMALEAKPSADIDAAFRRRLPLLSDELKSGFLSSIARRGDLQATSQVAEIARSAPSPALRIQAIRTLGQLGGEEALQVLTGMVADEAAMRRPLSMARLSAARRTLRMKIEWHAEAIAVLRELLATDHSKPLRMGALIELARHDPNRGWENLRQALTDTTGLLEAAPSLLELVDDERRSECYGALFATLSPQAKTLLLGYWRPRDGHEDKLRALSIDTAIAPDLREAALQALDR